MFYAIDATLKIPNFLNKIYESEFLQYLIFVSHIFTVSKQFYLTSLKNKHSYKQKISF
jgi:hypothetical protein